MSQTTPVMNQDMPPLDPHPLSEYVAWAGSRNREPILGVLKEKLPSDSERVLELASGSGMHINYFAPHFDHLHFQPSHRDIEVFDNIKKVTSEQGNNNIADPVHLDLTNPETFPWSLVEHSSGSRPLSDCCRGRIRTRIGCGACQTLC